MIHIKRNVRFTYLLLFVLLILLFVSRNRINAIDYINENRKPNNTSNEQRFLIFSNNRFIDWIRRIFKKKKQPTLSPTTKSPTTKPTKVPTKKPSKAPTKIPTKAPTKIPTNAPTKSSLQIACDFLGIANLTTCQSTTSFLIASDAIGTTIPTEIGLLTQLLHLDLLNEGLSSTIPSTISALSKLTVLDFGLNNLNSTIPSTISALTKLTYLALDSNQLSNTIPLLIGDLTNLSNLYLNTNELTGSLPSTLNRLTALQQLNLFNNPRLSGSIPSILCTNTTAGRNKRIFIDCGRNITCTCCTSGISGLPC